MISDENGKVRFLACDNWDGVDGICCGYGLFISLISNQNLPSLLNLCFKILTKVHFQNYGLIKFNLKILNHEFSKLILINIKY